ncbi:hypothetical protein K438DRAFT_1978507 [Mycena galopus ATCC 62051]|nr:hypothetical protein K438DRAFT_1978507 [Mycena galopus ATCC 62051]
MDMVAVLVTVTPTLEAVVASTLEAVVDPTSKAVAPNLEAVALTIVAIITRTLLHAGVPSVFNPPRKLVVIAPEDLQSVPAESQASIGDDSASDISSISTTTATTSTSADSCLLPLDGTSISTAPSTPPSGDTCLLPDVHTHFEELPRLEISRVVHWGDITRVLGASLTVADNIPFPVILKILKQAQFHLAVQEVTAYHQLARTCVIVPRLISLMAPAHESGWVVIVIEDAGKPFGQGRQAWDEISLTPAERTGIYFALVQIHGEGVLHGDPEPHNVLSDVTATPVFLPPSQTRDQPHRAPTGILLFAAGDADPTDEPFKSSAYLTEVVFPATRLYPALPSASSSLLSFWNKLGSASARMGVGAKTQPSLNPNRFRFNWGALPHGSVVVDVGGGIGSMSMLLASTYAEVDIADGSSGLGFVIQDRLVVVEMEKAWRVKCPELLDSGVMRFQAHHRRRGLHPPRRAARLARREATAPHTRLVLADLMLLLACVDDFGVGEDVAGSGGGCGEDVGTRALLANLDKASAHAYWMDLTMQVTFNGQERTLREIVALALSAGWKVVRVTKAPGSLFGHIVAVPIVASVPPQRRVRAGSGSAFSNVGVGGAVNPGLGVSGVEAGQMEMVERASSRCGTPTFGSRA